MDYAGVIKERLVIRTGRPWREGVAFVDAQKEPLDLTGFAFTVMLRRVGSCGAADLKLAAPAVEIDGNQVVWTVETVQLSSLRPDDYDFEILGLSVDRSVSLVGVLGLECGLSG